MPLSFSLSSAGANTVFFKTYQWGFHAVACFQKLRNSRKRFWSKVTSFNDRLACDDHSLWGCTLTSALAVFHLEKRGGAGKPCEENQTPKVILVGWKDLADLITTHVIHPSVLPDLHANDYGVLLTWGQNIKVLREVQSTLPFHSSPCTASKPIAMRNISMSSSWLWEIDWTNTVSSADLWNSNESPSELDFISGLEKINAVLPFNSVSSGKGYEFRACPHTSLVFVKDELKLAVQSCDYFRNG